MSRYKVVPPTDDGYWGGVKHEGSFYLQSADIIDKETGRRYRDGAYRVVDARKDMKPAKVGKGGTVPFYGESAWSWGENLLHDLALKERYGR